MIKSSSSTEIFFSPSTVLVEAGDNFTVNIELINCPPFNFLSITVLYNTTVLNASDVQVLIPWANLSNIYEDVGTIEIDAWDNVQSLEGNQTLVLIEFHAVANSNSTLELIGTELIDSELTQIPHNVVDGYVEIVGQPKIDLASIKQSYYLQQNVTLYGNITLEGVHINSLVGIEVDTPDGAAFLIRTVESGNVPPTLLWQMEISSFYPSDDEANPRTSFVAGLQAYFTAKVRNLANESLPLLITINAFDKYNSPIGFTIMQGEIASNATVIFIGPILIPPEAQNGTATACAGVYSDWPRNGGVPYCPEESTTFQIIDGSTDVSQIPGQTTHDFQADFNFTFKLPIEGGLGNYSIYATSNYKVQDSFTETWFLATLLGDFNGDGKVGVYDFARFSVSYGSKPGDQFWLPEADFDNNGKIGVYDFAVFGINYGKTV